MLALVARVVALVAGAGIAVAAIMTGLLGPAESVTAYWHAPPCSSAVRYSPRSDCVGAQEAVVTKVGFQTSSDDNGGTSYTYYADVRRPSGRVQRIYLKRAVYNAASPGDRARLSLWHGSVAAVAVDGVEDDMGPSLPYIWLAWAMLAWTGLGLVLWALLDEGTFARRTSTHVYRLMMWTVQGAVTAYPTMLAVDARHLVWWVVLLVGLLWALIGLVTAVGILEVGSDHPRRDDYFSPMF